MLAVARPLSPRDRKGLSTLVLPMSTTPPGRIRPAQPSPPLRCMAALLSLSSCFTASAQAFDRSYIGTYHGPVELRHYSPQGGFAEQQVIDTLTLTIAEGGVISGSTNNTGCRFSGLASAGLNPRSLAAGVTVTGCMGMRAVAGRHALSLHRVNTGLQLTILTSRLGVGRVSAVVAAKANLSHR